MFFAGVYYLNYPGTWQEVVSNLVDIYDLPSNTLTTTTLSEARRNIKAAAAASKVLFASGAISYANASSAVDIYDASNNSWSTAWLSQPRALFSTATLGNKVLFFTGGFFFTGGIDDARRMDIYDASANTWSAAELSKSLYSTPIAAGNQVFIGGGQVNAIAPGGWAYRVYTNQVWKLQF